MIRFIAIITFFTLSAFSTAIAEESKVDIQKLVRQQIENAKKKEVLSSNSIPSGLVKTEEFDEMINFDDDIALLGELVLKSQSAGEVEYMAAIKNDEQGNSDTQDKIIINEAGNHKNEELLQSVISYLVRPFESVEGKLIILGAFSVIVFSIVGMKRSKQEKQATVKQHAPDDFKKNIQLVREERFIKPIDPELKKIRTNLYLDARYLNQSNEFLTETARNLNIAKTELILASRFNRHSMRVN